jgi:hypothetical protein
VELDPRATTSIHLTSLYSVVKEQCSQEPHTVLHGFRTCQAGRPVSQKPSPVEEFRLLRTLGKCLYQDNNAIPQSQGRRTFILVSRAAKPRGPALPVLDESTIIRPC